MAIAPLTPTELTAQLNELPEWAVVEGKLRRELRFRNFIDAFAFMTQCALISEKRNHHPEWLNVYSRVTIDLTTHEAGGISVRDVEWAKAADKLYCSFPRADGKAACCG